MTFIAWATTSRDATGWALGDPGITIVGRPEHAEPGDGEEYVAEIDGDPGTDEEGALDADNATAILASHGWRITGPWQPSTIGYAAEVERSSA